MDKNDHQRIQELFLAALELPAQQRGAWLVEQCGGNERVLAEVRALLEHDRPGNDPLEKGIDEALGVLPSTVIKRASGGDGPAASDVTEMDSDVFLSRLSEVGVLTQEETAALNRAVSSAQTSPTPRQIAAQLVSQGKLTDYQASALLNGQPELLIDKYLILDLLDAGGMGMVFKAIHRPMNRTVAIKMIAQHLLASADQVKRFQREVRVAATLEHPNIVRSYDADQSRGVHFLVMEYVRGETLTSIVQREGPMPVERAIDCIRQAAEGLRYAQNKGVIHRDVKPGNLMLDDDGSVKVLDLGLANIDESFRLAQESSITDDQDVGGGPASAGSELTTAGAVLGTVSFMAPEQSLDARAADGRADIYSLGCTLYYLLVGDVPYKGDTVFQVFLQHRDGPIPSIRAERPDVADEVDALCQKMLAKDPDDRYQTMGELIDAIEDCGVELPEARRTRKERRQPLPTIEVDTSHTTYARGPAKVGRGKRRTWLWGALAIVGLSLPIIMLAWPFGNSDTPPGEKSDRAGSAGSPRAGQGDDPPGSSDPIVQVGESRGTDVVDLVSRFDPGADVRNDDGYEGEWRRLGGEMQHLQTPGNANHVTHLSFRHDSVEDYRFEMDFDSVAGILCINLPLRDRNVTLRVRGKGPSESGLSYVKGRDYQVQPAVIDHVSGRRRLHVEVVHVGEDVSIVARLDGNTFVDYYGELNAASQQYGADHFVRPACVGIRLNGEMAIHSATLAPISAADLLAGGEWGVSD